jgi:hypothetical protein
MAGAEESEISFHSGGERVFATLRRARGLGTRPASVLVHGFGAFRDELTGFRELAEKLSAAGITSLRPDMRGCGKSGASGHMHPIWDWVEDVQAATSWLQADAAPALQRREDHEEIGDAVALVFVVVTSGSSGLRRDRSARLDDQLLGGLVQTHERTIGISRPLVRVQHVFHGGDEARIGFGREPSASQPLRRQPQ